MLIKSRVWLESDGNVVLGNGRVTLLKKIIEKGSLSKAAKEMGISYRKAWNLVDSINKSSKLPFIITSKGGTNGGGTVVTEYGQKKIAQFEMLKERYYQFLKEQEHLFNED